MERPSELAAVRRVIIEGALKGQRWRRWTSYSGGRLGWQAQAGLLVSTDFAIEEERTVCLLTFAS
jgi:hypothetical protein